MNFLSCIWKKSILTLLDSAQWLALHLETQTFLSQQFQKYNKWYVKLHMKPWLFHHKGWVLKMQTCVDNYMHTLCPLHLWCDKWTQLHWTQNDSFEISGDRVALKKSRNWDNHNSWQYWVTHPVLFFFMNEFIQGNYVKPLANEAYIHYTLQNTSTPEPLS